MNSYIDCVIWCLKYVAVPISASLMIYKLIVRIIGKNQRYLLKQKVVVITGASSGIGEALAHAFYDHGCKVVLAARRESELNRVKQDLLSKKLPFEVEAPVVICMDLANLESLESFVQKVYDLCGHVDILINNGGVSHRGTIINTKYEVDKQIMYINYLGPLCLTKAVLRRMVKRKCGHIVFVSSVQGRIAIPERSAYTSSKHALQAFGDSLRAEMHQHNIKVSVISPGYVKTAVSVNALTDTGERYGVMDVTTASGFTAEYVADKILEMIVREKDELVLCSTSVKFAIFLRYFSPSLYFWVMAKRARRL